MCRLKLGMLLLVALICNAGAIVQAKPIRLIVAGTTDSAAMTFVDNTTSWDLTLPAATLTPQVEYWSNNVGVIPGSTTIQFAGVSQAGLVVGVPNYVEIPSLLTFTTPAGSFTFDSFVNGADMVVPNDFTDGTMFWIFPGIVSGGGFTATDSAIYMYFNTDGSYGDLAWVFVALGIPEPSTMVLAGLGICGLVWQRRRRQ